MSLLNEMLHDLAKQKAVSQKAPLFTTFTTVARPKQAKSIPTIVLVGLMVFAISLFYFFNKQIKKRKKCTRYRNGAYDKRSRYCLCYCLYS